MEVSEHHSNPQDSVIGPFLFLLFISDINTYLPQSTNLTKFCDDLLTYEQTFNRIVDNTQLAVDRIQRWAEDNKMRLSIKKQSICTLTQTKTDQLLPCMCTDQLLPTAR